MIKKRNPRGIVLLNFLPSSPGIAVASRDLADDLPSNQFPLLSDSLLCLSLVADAWQAHCQLITACQASFQSPHSYGIMYQCIRSSTYLSQHSRWYAAIHCRILSKIPLVTSLTNQLSPRGSSFLGAVLILQREEKDVAIVL